MQINKTPEKVIWWKILLVPVLLAAAMWTVYLLDPYVPILLRSFGIRPREVQGLIGIFTMPLLHSGWEHIVSNTAPILVLGALIYMHYKEVAGRIFIFSWLVTGFWVWVMARSHTNHIGASGMVYAFTSFLFFSGLFRKHKQLVSVSFLVTLLYGGLWWGVLPIDVGEFAKMSWEGHLAGGMAGLLLAINYRKVGKQREVFDWELLDEEEDDPGFDDWKLPPDPPKPGQRQIKVRYVYRPSKPQPKPNQPKGNTQNPTAPSKPGTQQSQSST